MATNIKATDGLANRDESLSGLDFYVRRGREDQGMAWLCWLAAGECETVKQSRLSPTKSNLIGTVVWAVLVSFSAAINGVLSWQRRDSFIALARAAQLLVTLPFLALIVPRWRNGDLTCPWSSRTSRTTCRKRPPD